MLDAEITPREILDLTNAAMLRGLFERLGYPAALEIKQAPENLGITDATLTRAIRRVEKLALRKGSGPGDNVEVWLFEVTRVTSQVIRQIASAFRRRFGYFLLAFTADYASLNVALLEAVLPDASSKREVTLHPWVITLDRAKVERVPLRILRRVSFTEESGVAQYHRGGRGRAHLVGESANGRPRSVRPQAPLQGRRPRRRGAWEDVARRGAHRARA